MKKTILVLLIIFGLATYFLQDSFSLKNITYENDLDEQYTPKLNEQEEHDLLSILSQPFAYLGKGHQSYAFLSKDGQYVIKFFKFTYLKTSWIPLTKKQEKTRQKKLKRLFTGYRVAYELDKENTGVLYVHLSKSDNLHKKLTVKDLYGFTHQINLDDVYFVIQKKATVTRRVLQDLLKHHELDLFKKRIGQLIDLYISEYKRGLFDSDHNIMSNTGFLPDRALRIDVGRLSIKPEMQNQAIFIKDLRKVISKRVDRWLKINYPKEYQELHQDIDTKLAVYEEISA